MDKRTAVHVTSPRPNPTLSYWQDPPSDIASWRSTSNLPEEVDIIIVGSGISGASIAYNLLERDGSQKILMLEAREACSGATGRNGGHTKAASYRSYLDNVSSLGGQQAAQIARLEYDNIKALHAFARVHGIECDLNSCDTVDIIYDQGQWDEAVKSISLMRENMEADLAGAANYTFHTAEEAKGRFHVAIDGPEKVIGAISYEAGSLSSYKYVIGVLKMCLSQGLNLQTNTLVESISKGSTSKWQAVTDRGNVTAPKLVLATNGYTAKLLPSLQGVIVPLRGQITAQRPGSSMPQEGLRMTYSFIYQDGYEYMISRPKGTRSAGDIVIGGGLARAPDEGIYEYGTTDDADMNSFISQYLTQSTSRYFGSNWGKDHKDGRVRHEWTGIMGYSPDGFPLIGLVPGEQNLFISAAFQGHGMVLCHMSAIALATMMCEDDGVELDSWFPNVFRISSERMNKSFQGRLHVKQAKEMELKAQL